MIHSQADIEGALVTLSQAPTDILQTVRDRVLRTLFVLHQKLRVKVDLVAEILDSFNQKSEKIEQVAMTGLQSMVEFAPYEADVRFNHVKVVSPGDLTGKTICQLLFASRSLGLELDDYVLKRYGRSRVTELVQSCDAAENKHDSRVSEFLQHERYGTETWMKKAVSTGIKLLVAERLFGNAGISLYAVHAMKKFQNIRYQLLHDVVRTLSSGDGALGPLSEKMRTYGLLILKTQEAYNGGFIEKLIGWEFLVNDRRMGRESERVPRHSWVESDQASRHRGQRNSLSERRDDGAWVRLRG